MEARFNCTNLSQQSALTKRMKAKPETKISWARCIYLTAIVFLLNDINIPGIYIYIYLANRRKQKYHRAESYNGSVASLFASKAPSVITMTTLVTLNQGKSAAPLS